MSGQIAAWHAEHLNFARLLRLLEEQVVLFAKGEPADYTLMRDIVHYLRHFPELHHHRYENEVYQRMAKRTPALEPLAAQLLQEHRVLAASGAKLAQLLEAVLDDTPVTRAELETAAATYLVYYRNHIETEETSMLPRVAEAMRPDDWASVAAAVAEKGRGDPLFGAHAEERYRALRLEIEREVAG